LPHANDKRLSAFAENENKQKIIINRSPQKSKNSFPFSSPYGGSPEGEGGWEVWRG